MPRVLQYTSASRALRIRTRVLWVRNLTRRVPRSLMYSSRPGARTAHIGSVRLARENPRFSELRNLVRCVPQVLTYI